MDDSPFLNTMEPMNRDRFELLSAYLDGEVSPDERCQVEAWLESDPQLQSLRDRLLRLRHNLSSMPMPEPAQSADVLASRVFSTIERRNKRRWAWGGTAIAAAMIGAVSFIIPGTLDPAPQLVRVTETEPSALDVPDDALMIALDRPIVDIPEPPNSNTKANKQTIQ